MPTRDYYIILGITRTAKDTEIRKAFRQKALEFHPDRNKAVDAEERFKEINEANQVLSDTKKRAEYDEKLAKDAAAQPKTSRTQTRHKRDHTQNKQSANSTSRTDRDAGRARAKQDTGRTQSHRRNAPPPPRPPRDGSDIEVTVELTREEALSKHAKEIKFHWQDNCMVCSGSGKPKSELFDHCVGCRGKGVVPRGSTLEVDIPSCVKTGKEARVRCSGQGNVGKNGGKRGNLYVNFVVRTESAKPPPRYSYTSNTSATGSYTGPQASTQGDSYGRVSYSIICDLCGIDTTVPFKPRYSSALYCRDCYRIVRG